MPILLFNRDSEMLIPDNTLNAITHAMSDVVNTGYHIANRVEKFSHAVNKIDSAEQSSNTTTPHDLSSELSELARQVAKYQALGRLASGQLGLYSLIASDGKA
jgi:hypothetical protein